MTATVTIEGLIFAAWAGQFETGDEIDVVTRHFVIERHKRRGPFDP